MNDEGLRRLDERLDDERAVALLRDAATCLEASRGDPAKSVERVLARGTDRLFSCASPLGEVYVGGSTRGEISPCLACRRVGDGEQPGTAPYPLSPGGQERRYHREVRLRGRGESRAARRRGRAGRGAGRISVPRPPDHGDFLSPPLPQRQEDKARKPSALPLGRGSDERRLQTLQGLPSGGGLIVDAIGAARRSTPQ